MVLPDPPAAPSLSLGFTRGQGAAVALFPPKKKKKGVGISALTALHLPLGPGRGCGACGGVQDSQIPMALLGASFAILGGWEGKGCSPSCRDPREVDLGWLYISMAIFWGRGSSSLGAARKLPLAPQGTLRPHLIPERS